MSGNGIKCFTIKSTVVKRVGVLCVGLFELMTSETFCARLVSKVFVECRGRNSCCVGARFTHTRRCCVGCNSCCNLNYEGLRIKSARFPYEYMEIVCEHILSLVELIILNKHDM